MGHVLRNVNVPRLYSYRHYLYCHTLPLPLLSLLLSPDILSTAAAMWGTHEPVHYPHPIIILDAVRVSVEGYF